MAKSMLIILAFVATAYSAAINTRDAPLSRAVRSPCPECGPGGPPPLPGLPPPPPPLLLRTQNWSGLARSSDGLQNAIFSGAAAAADQGAQTGGEAYSLATSSAGDGGSGSGRSGNIGAGGNEGSGYKYASGGFKESHFSYHTDDGLNVHGTQQSQNLGGPSSLAGGQALKSGYSSFSSLSSSGNQGNGGVGQGQVADSGFTGSGKDDQIQRQNEFQQSSQGGGFSSASAKSQSSGAGHFEAGQQEQQNSFGGHGHGNGRFSLGQEQELSFGGNGGGHQNGHFESGSSFGRSNSHYGGQGAQSGFQQNQGGFGRSNAQSSASANQGGASGKYSSFEQQSTQPQDSYTFGNANGQDQGSAFGNGQVQESGSFGQAQGYAGGHKSGGYYGGFRSSNVEGQSALKGALDLASQGLQTAHQSSCSTCGKSSYALSNAKSYSGPAVALSIGG